MLKRPPKMELTLKQQIMPLSRKNKIQAVDTEWKTPTLGPAKTSV